MVGNGKVDGSGGRENLFWRVLMVGRGLRGVEPSSGMGGRRWIALMVKEGVLTCTWSSDSGLSEAEDGQSGGGGRIWSSGWVKFRGGHDQNGIIMLLSSWPWPGGELSGIDGRVMDLRMFLMVG